MFVDNKYSKKIILYRRKDAVNKFIKTIFNEYNYCRKVMKKYELTNICWICDRVIENSENKVRDHCHITGKNRGAAHYSCNISLKITKTVPVIFHNLKGYDGHLIFKELGRFNVNVSVMPNGLEKYINIIFIDSMQFMNCGLDKLVKIGDEDFKY